MLKLFKYINLFSGGGASIHQCTAVLDEACSIRLSKEINGDYTLDFDFPYASEKSSLIKENYEVECLGQRYRIVKITRENSGGEIMHVNCTHVFHFKARNIHVQNFGGDTDTIGANPYDVLNKALSKTNLSVFTYEELEELGMTGLGADGFLIDFESVDKTTPYDIIQQIITNCGKGELYVDNEKCALVERIGTDNGLRLDISLNMQNVTIERDITNMITRLYPYGKDDAHIGSVNGGKQYIESDNVKYDGESLPGYGVKEGYKDYSEYTDPDDILSHAQWEFDPENENRIDVPDINITGSFTDLSKLAGEDVYGVSLGDTVHVNDHGTTITERVIKIEEYPFEPLETTISIGRIKKDLFFYLKQMGRSAKQTVKNTTSTGKVSAKAVSGTITSDGSTGGISSTKGTITAAVSDGALQIKKSSVVKCRIGNDGGSFVFNVYDNSSTPQKVMCIDTKGLTVNAYSIQVGSTEITEDDDGNLLINGKKVLTEE